MRLIGFLFLILAFMAPIDVAHATCGDGASTCFVRTVGGLWNANTTWATSSGGASCTCTPATGDSVTIDANSGASTINAAISLTNLDMSASAGAVTHNSGITVTITGTVLKLPSSVAYNVGNSTAGFTFTGTGTLTVNSNGKTFGNFTVNGTGSVVPADAFATLNTSTLTVTQGTFDASVNNVNVTTSSFVSNNSNTRTVSCGSGTWTINGTGLLWDFTTTTGLTWNTNTCVVNLNSAAFTGAMTFQSGGKTFNSVTYTTNSGAVRVNILGSPTFTTFTYTPGGAAGWLAISAGTTLTVTNTLTLGGTQAKPLFLSSDSSAGAIATIHASAASPTATWATIQNITVNTNTMVATNSINLGNNTGITITAPSAGGGGIIGG